MMPAGPGFGMQYGGMAQQYGGGMGPMGPMPHSPYMLGGLMGGMGGFVPGAAAYGYPSSGGVPAPTFPAQHPASGGGGHYGATPFGQQQQAQPPYGQQQQHSR